MSRPSYRKQLESPNWHQFVKLICNRHFGIGGDGILIVTQALEDSIPEMIIYNADGTQAKNCLDGLRCVAHYLFTHHGFSEELKIKIGSRINTCNIDIDPSQDNQLVVTSHVGFANYIGQHKLKILEDDFCGHEVHVGNPHLVIFDKTSLEWLQNNGKLFESHSLFPDRINVEFVFERKPKNYDVFIYERGCGITLSCGSGAAAITGLLLHQKAISKNEKITFHMPGGSFSAWCDSNGEIVLQAGATLVYKGTIN